MRLRWRELLTSKIGVAARWDRWDYIALGLAVLATLWVFALKLKTFYDLGYSGDLFVSLQTARSWLEGKGPLRDNCWGNVLAIHTYFLLLPLGLLQSRSELPGYCSSFPHRWEQRTSGQHASCASSVLLGRSL
jgi:hypothetical protein